jgi:DNA mismatch endonuclease Vsr
VTVITGFVAVAFFRLWESDLINCAAKMERILREKLRGGRFSNVAPNRSRLMGRIRSRGNQSTERRFRLALVRAGLSGWVLHPKTILGTPDFYFAERKIAVFVDGCFWEHEIKCDLSRTVGRIKDFSPGHF